MDVGDYLETIRAALAAAGMDPAEREALLGAYASTGQSTSCTFPFPRVFTDLSFSKLSLDFRCVSHETTYRSALKLYSEDLIEMTI